MEKRCEFCMALRPVVFCKSDAAHLCLSCDAKVHSANALSYRHPRTLVCESCSFQPALVQCFDHQMFMCQSCDISHHVSLDHQKKIVSCYMGCPSAKDLALLWGLDLKDQLSSDAQLDGVASSLYAKVVKEQKKSSCGEIVQQIMELERLQLSEGIDDSWVRKERRMLENNCDGTSEESPFPQLESFSNAGNGDAFWQYRSPVQSNEIWLQNMQDLGVCEEVESCFDDVKIPDVDVTFRNFEEVFGDDKYKHPLFGKMDALATTVEQKHHDSDPRPSSYSISRITGESNDLSPTFPQQHKEKKNVARQGQYTSPRSKSDFKNRVLKVQGHEGDSPSF